MRHGTWAAHDALSSPLRSTVLYTTRTLEHDTHTQLSACARGVVWHTAGHYTLTSTVGGREAALVQYEALLYASLHVRTLGVMKRLS